MKDGLSHFTDIFLPLIGLAIFFIWFLLMLYWVLRVVPKKKYEMLSLIPLRNEESRQDG
jgi:cbb3-type cytochrome oxidase subunit 3